MPAEGGDASSHVGQAAPVDGAPGEHVEAGASCPATVESFELVVGGALVDDDDRPGIVAELLGGVELARIVESVRGRLDDHDPFQPECPLHLAVGGDQRIRRAQQRCRRGG